MLKVPPILMGAARAVAGRARLTILAVAALVGVSLGVTGAGIGLEHALTAWNAGLRQHPASGRIHIVEIDARSIAAIDRWPWSRAEHARVIDRLRAAGAARIAFDVDFSTRSDEGGDAALAAAIARSGDRVVLPTFRQAAGSNGDAWIDALPPARLREHAALAAVSILPDADGDVREAPIGTITAGTPRPSLSAMIADRSGQAGDAFPIDYAIDPASIPRHSYIDILQGRFDPRSIAGRQIVIGATAIELGDRYAVPNYGVIPGVVIQALAAETLVRGVPMRVGWPLALALAIVLGGGLVRLRGWRLAAGAFAAPLGLFALAVATQALSGAVLQIVPALASVLTCALGTAAQHAARAWHHRRFYDQATGLPNRFALLARLHDLPGGTIVIARVIDHDRLAAGLSTEAESQLMLRVCDRIRLVGSTADIHCIAGGMLAWIATVDLELGSEQYDKLRVLMLSPIEVEGRRVDVSLAIGAATYAGAQSRRTLAHAVLAAEQAIADGSGYHVHDASEEETVDRELSLLGELGDAILNGEFHVVYQPKLELASRRITSVEALVRWQHPTRGFLRPDMFIPLLERHDRIGGLTLYVIERTLRDLDAWAAAGHRISAAVNISVKLLTSDAFRNDVLRLIAASGGKASQLIFEVTESPQ